MVKKLNEPIRRWEVCARFGERDEYESQLIEAHAHRTERDGGHRFYLRGPFANSPATTVKYIGPGLCRDIRLVG